MTGDALMHRSSEMALHEEIYTHLAMLRRSYISLAVALTLLHCINLVRTGGCLYFSLKV